MATDIPDDVAALIATLEEHGFTRGSELVGTGFGDHSIELDRAPIAVRITSDRGRWTIELTHRKWDEWFDPDVWRACLEDRKPPDEPRSLGDQSAFILSNVDRLGEVGRANTADLLPCLRQAHAVRARRRLGF